jgi:hypothetical protein
MNTITLADIFPTLKACLAKDAKTAPVPFLGQVASAVEDVEAVRDYNKHLEAALRDPGAAFVAVVADGELEDNPKSFAAVRALDLCNTVVLGVVVNPKVCQLAALEIVRRAMRLLHAQSVAFKGARWDVKLGKPAFNVGPLNKGTEVFFINLLVRTTEELGPIDPA